MCRDHQRQAWCEVYELANDWIHCKTHQMTWKEYRS